MMQFIAAVGISFVYLAVLYFLGDWVLQVWTKGQVHIEQPFFLLLLLSVVAETLWTTIWIPICAINRHAFIAYSYGVLALLAVVAGYFFVSPLGIAGVVVPLLIVHLIMLAAAAIRTSRELPR